MMIIIKNKYVSRTRFFLVLWLCHFRERKLKKEEHWAHSFILPTTHECMCVLHCVGLCITMFNDPHPRQITHAGCIPLWGCSFGFNSYVEKCKFLWFFVGLLALSLLSYFLKCIMSFISKISPKRSMQSLVTLPLMQGSFFHVWNLKS